MPVLRFQIHYIYDTITATANTGAGFTSFDYRCDALTDSDLCSAGLFSVWNPLIVDAMATTGVVIGHQLYDLTGAGWPTAIAGDLSASNRGSVLLGLPSQNAVVIKRRDGVPGRSHRGRIFLSPIGVPGLQLLSNGDLVDTTYGPYVAIATQMKAPVTVAGATLLTPVLWHRSTATSTDVVATAVQEILCVRRSKRTWRFDDVPQF